MASLVSVNGGYLSVLPGMLAMGVGIGLAMTPSTAAITSSLPHNRQGVASALNDVTREFGTGLGVALLGAVLSAGYKTAINFRLDGVPANLADTALEGVANAVAAAAGPRAHALVRAAQQSFVNGWQNAMWAGAALMAVLFIYGEFLCHEVLPVFFTGPWPGLAQARRDRRLVELSADGTSYGIVAGQRRCADEGRP